MIIELKKFGDILTSREAGREALAAFSPTLKSLDDNEQIKIDFKGVSVLTPSWADEFIRAIIEKYGKRVSFTNDKNPSVQAALQFANPKLDLSQITIFEDKLVFDEKLDDKIHGGEKSWLVLTFPYNDRDALQILKNNKITNISLNPVDTLSDKRLKTVMKMLNEADIKTKIEEEYPLGLPSTRSKLRT